MLTDNQNVYAQQPSQLGDHAKVQPVDVPEPTAATDADAAVTNDDWHAAIEPYDGPTVADGSPANDHVTAC